MHRSVPRILIVDDDPHHLEIYGMLIQRAGYEPVPVVVKFQGTDFSIHSDIAAIMLDYKLNTNKTTKQLAQELQTLYPHAPILLLSDVWDLPLEMKPYAAMFVRKGEPEKLFEALQQLLPTDNGPVAA